MVELYHSAIASSAHQTNSAVTGVMDSPVAQNKTIVQELEHVYINLMQIKKEHSSQLSSFLTKTLLGNNCQRLVFAY